MTQRAARSRQAYVPTLRAAASKVRASTPKTALALLSATAKGQSLLPASRLYSCAEMGLTRELAGLARALSFACMRALRRLERFAGHKAVCA